MKRIIAHWTGGTHKCTQLDKKHYHFIADGKGNIHKGNFDISDNESTKTPYAAHTLRCNTGSIGISTCGMAGAIESPLKFGRYPVTKAGWDAMCLKTAELCLEYNILVTKKTVLTHAEVQKTLGIKQRGKWDFTVLKFAPLLKGQTACGDRLRDDVAWLMQKMRAPEPIPVAKPAKPAAKPSQKPPQKRKGMVGPIVAIIALISAGAAIIWGWLENLFSTLF